MEALLAVPKPIDFVKSTSRSVLAGRTAIVTGGASGIGLGIAQTLAEAGVFVTIADINAEKGDHEVKRLSAKQLNVQFAKVDVTSWSEQVAAFELAASASKQETVDIVVTSAGIETKVDSMPHPTQLDKPIKPPTETLDINLYGTYYSMFLALWYFARSPLNPAKQILFISSMAGYGTPPQPGITSDYAGSKYGVRGLWQAAIQHRSTYGNARMNLLAPAFIDTPLLPPERLAQARAIGLKVGTVRDCAYAAMRIFCDEEIHGKAICVNGIRDQSEDHSGAMFDLCDDVVGRSGGEVLYNKIADGSLIS